MNSFREQKSKFERSECLRWPKTIYKELFKKILVNFICQEDPILATLEWTAQQMMQIEAEDKVGAKKRKHHKYRCTYFSGVIVDAWILG
ncbi:MAG: hypothetical protein ACETWK_07955 [Candidatus Aminicenantaceae bacterium]